MRHDERTIGKSDAVDLQISARNAIKEVLGVLAELAFDCGLDTIELISLLREVSIRRAARRQLCLGDRVSVSRISAVTGISRGEISLLLKPGSSTKSSTVPHENLISKILRAWHSDPKFQTRRRPRALKLYGRGATFESLVSIYGRGLPARAILDELISLEAIKLLPSQLVVPSKPLAIHKRVVRKDMQALRAGIIDLVRPRVADQLDLEPKITSPQRRRNFKRDF